MADDLQLALGHKSGKSTREQAQEKVESAYEEFRSIGDDAHDIFNIDSFDMGVEDTGWF